MKLQGKIFFKKQVNTTTNNLMLTGDTLAMEFSSRPATLFSAAELWNIRRRKRSILVR